MSNFQCFDDHKLKLIYFLISMRVFNIVVTKQYQLDKGVMLDIKFVTVFLILSAIFLGKSVQNLFKNKVNWI